MKYLSTQFGFSLIELMIVITIISILAATAVPTYQRYVQRARFAEVIAVTQLFKTSVALALQQGAAMDELTNGVYGIPHEPKSTKNLASVKVEKGIITATATELAANNTYILKPNPDGSTWSVDGTCLKNGLCNE